MPGFVRATETRLKNDVMSGPDLTSSTANSSNGPTTEVNMEAIN
jgi:hypothetical protein